MATEVFAGSLGTTGTPAPLPPGHSSSSAEDFRERFPLLPGATDQIQPPQRSQAQGASPHNNCGRRLPDFGHFIPLGHSQVTRRSRSPTPAPRGAPLSPLLTTPPSTGPAAPGSSWSRPAPARGSAARRGCPPRPRRRKKRRRRRRRGRALPPAAGRPPHTATAQRRRPPPFCPRPGPGSEGGR